MKTKHLLSVNAVIFGLIAVLHVVRLVLRWPANIAGWPVPLWLSVAAVLVAGYLSYVNYSAAKKSA